VQESSYHIARSHGSSKQPLNAVNTSSSNNLRAAQDIAAHYPAAQDIAAHYPAAQDIAAHYPAAQDTASLVCSSSLLLNLHPNTRWKTQLASSTTGIVYGRPCGARREETGRKRRASRAITRGNCRNHRTITIIAQSYAPLLPSSTLLSPPPATPLAQPLLANDGITGSRSHMREVI